VVSPEIIAHLEPFGQASLAARASGCPIDDPRFGWNYIGGVVMALGGNERDVVIQELCEAVSAAPSQARDHVTFGAYRLIAEYDGNMDDERFWELCDASLEHMRSLRFSSGHLTGYEARRWLRTHGDLRSSFDGLVDVTVPEPDQAPTVDELDVGTCKMLALTDPLPDGNAFFAERGVDGGYVVYSERQRSLDDPTRSRYDEDELGRFKTMADLLRAVGRWFDRHPYWADDDLEPYFTSRRL
jgi:hypothetical protein